MPPERPRNFERTIALPLCEPRQGRCESSGTRVMKTTSRRTFLKQSTTLAASLAMGPKLTPWAMAALAPSPIRAWITAGEKRFKELAVQPWGAATALTPESASSRLVNT